MRLLIGSPEQKDWIFDHFSMCSIHVKLLFKTYLSVCLSCTKGHKDRLH